MINNVVPYRRYIFFGFPIFGGKYNKYIETFIPSLQKYEPSAVKI